MLTPWQSTFFTAGFSMLKDRFGVPWLINVVDQAMEESAQV